MLPGCQIGAKKGAKQNLKKMEEEIKDLFNCQSGGYITISRPILLHAMNPNKEFSYIQMYVRMLVQANYSARMSSNGFVIKRGQLDMTTAEVVRQCGLARTTGYRMVRQLEANKLVERIFQKHHQYFNLPLYEEHCGHKVRPQESADAVHAEPTESDELFEDFFGFYYHIMEKPPLDKAKAYREWQKLSTTEREEAMTNLEYFQETTQTQRYKKSAWSYLKDKSYKR